MPRKIHPNSIKNLEKRKPFVRGDPRIKPNPGGKVKNFDDLRKFLQEIAHEEVQDERKNKILRLREIVMNLSEKDFIEFAYGKVPLSQVIDVTSGGKPINWMNFINNDNDDASTNEDKPEETSK